MKTKKDRSQKSAIRNQKKPLIGLAAAIREAMQQSRWPITYKTLYARLGDMAEDKSKVLNGLKDFFKRGEILRPADGKLKYNFSFKRPVDSPVRDRILKAVAISSNFTTVDIRKLVTGAKQNYVEAVMKDLVKEGHVVLLGEKARGKHGGRIRVFNVVDRVKFRMEVVK